MKIIKKTRFHANEDELRNKFYKILRDKPGGLVEKIKETGLSYVTAMKFLNGETIMASKMCIIERYVEKNEDMLKK